MTLRSTDRLSAIVTLGTLLVIATIGAFSLIAIQASRHLPPGAAWRADAALLYQNEFLFVTEDPINAFYVIRAVKIPSGQERITDLPVLLPWRGWVSDDNRLWVAASHRVVEFDGLTRTEYRPQRKLNEQIGRAFLYQGSLAVIDYDGCYRLLVLNNGEWEERGEIALPGKGRSWRKSDIDGEEELVPLTVEPRSSGKSGSEYVSVINVEETLHLFHLGTESGTIGYQRGFEFVTRDHETASALSPENVSPDVTGWKKLDFPIGDFWSACAHIDGPILATRSSSTEPIRIWGPNQVENEKPFRVIKEFIAGPTSSVLLVSSSDGRAVYSIEHQSILGPRVQKYENGEWQDFPMNIDTALAKILRWTFQVLVQIGLVLAIGTALLISAGCRIARSQHESYQFGQDVTRLASLPRRCLARGLDILFLLSPLIVQILISWPQLREEQIARFYWGSGESKQAFADLLFVELRPVEFVMTSLFIVLIWTQSRWGLTPGKWLLGLRTFRTTLRPCGFSRSLLRELLMAVDAPLLLTPLPGVISILATENRQRLGDLAADSLVVDIRGDKSRGQQCGVLNRVN